MKSKRIFFKTVLILILCSIVCSCDNFINGAKLKEELEKEIDYSNATVYTVRVQADPDTGTLNTGAGDNKLRETDPLKISFTNKSGYRFVKWQVYLSNEEVTNSDYFDFEDDTALETTATLIKGAENLVIKPIAVVVIIPSADILITTSHGKISPSGTANYLQNQEETLIFNADSDYQFIGWQVFDPASGDNITDENYITFGDIKEFSTTFVYTGTSEDKISLTIEPECEPRPQILSTTPAYSAAGVYRDTRIQVMFDQIISKDAIYFTDDEIAELQADGNIMLEPYVNGDTSRYYGYISSDGLTYFKNISIINATTKQSILENFEAPYFNELSNLIIPTKSGDEAPNAGITIIAELSKELFYKAGENKIEMSGSRKWNYRVNSLTDSDGPDFEECHLLKNSDSTELTASQEVSLEQENLKAIYLPDNQFSLYVKFNDSGSGPEKLTVAKKRIYDEYYNPVVEKAVILSDDKSEIKVDDTVAYFGVMSSTEGEYQIASDVYYSPKTFDLSDDKDGIYEIDIIASDLSGNPATKTYYVIKDTEANVISELSAEGSDQKITLSWKNSSDIDVSTVKVNEDSIDCSVSENVTKEITGLKNGKTYEYKITAKDIFGHECSYSLKRSTIPKEISDLSATVDDTKISLAWSNPSGNLSSIKIYYGTDSDCSSLYNTYDSTTNSATVTSLTGGTVYYFKAISCYKDSDETELTNENSSAIRVSTMPYSVTNLKAKSNDGSIRLSWTPPSQGDFTGYIIDYGTTEEYGKTISTNKGLSEYDVSSLKNGTTYYFKVTTYDSDGNKCAAPATISKSTIPVAITSISASTMGTFIELQWDKPSGNYTGAKVYIGDSEGFDITSHTPIETTYFDNLYEEDTQGNAFENTNTYYFKLYSYYDDDGDIIESSTPITVHRNTQPALPEITNVYDLDNKQTNFIWNNTKDLTLYVGIKYEKTSYSDGSVVMSDECQWKYSKDTVKIKDSDISQYNNLTDEGIYDETLVLKVIDSEGNESFPSKMPYKLASVPVVTATKSNYTVTLTLANNDGVDFDYYEIDYSIDGYNGNYTDVFITTDSTVEISDVHYALIYRVLNYNVYGHCSSTDNPTYYPPLNN